MLLQTISWMVFSASLLLQLGVIFVTYAFGFQMFLSVMGVAGVLCFVAELLMVTSLTMYRCALIDLCVSLARLPCIRVSVQNVRRRRCPDFLTVVL